MADKQPAADEDRTDAPLEPSGIAQFVEHDRCPRYLKQRVDPGDEPDARDWQEAFGLMNIALLGKGREFEATQIEALATDATKVIAPQLDDPTKAAVPDITVDETWADSPRGRTEQLAGAITDAAQLTATADENTPYILLYQAPLGRHLAGTAVYGDADCIALAPADTVPTPDDQPVVDTEPDNAAVVARVIDCKSARDEQPAHRVQVATYCALLERTLAEGPATPLCRIEASVLTQTTAVTAGHTQSPFDLPTFRRAEWELFVTHLLDDTGPVTDALADDLADLPFTLDQVCNNCAYREACATRAVENPTVPQSLALLGLDASVQRTLREAGITSLRELATLLPRRTDTTPLDDPPALNLKSERRRTLEKTLPAPIHETVLRAQALLGALDPDYPAYDSPPAIPGHDWIPLPDDRCAGWSNIDSADPGELIHVALFARPDAARNRIAALGACVAADAYDGYVTVGEVSDAVPDDDTIADNVEAALFERFLAALFDAIETVATALGEPEQAVIHCYTYSEHELDALAEGLDRHSDSLDRARALRALCSLDGHGHTDVDQSMVTAVQPVLNEYFALSYPSQGLLTVTEQFVPRWTMGTFDPLDARPDDPPLQAIFREQFLNERVPYLDGDRRIHLHVGRGPLAEGSVADAADTDSPTPDGWYPIRKRAGGQFPLEYIWAAVPKRPGESTPRLTPDTVAEWAVDEDHEPLYRQEIGRFYYRTREQTERLQRGDVEHLVERLSYALWRLIDAIPYKDAYHPKESIDVTRLAAFDLPVSRLPEAARDYLHMEGGTRRDRTIAHYRQSLRQRARSGRSIPIRCTDLTAQTDGSLVIEGELAYDALFDDEDTAATVARQARLRSGDGPGSGSWRVVTRLQPENAPAQRAPDDATTPRDPSARGYTEADVDDREALKHSPPVLVDALDQQTGRITLTAFPHRFRRNGSRFRVDHCGWHCPAGSNVREPSDPPAHRPGYVAGRDTVWIDTDAVYMLDPMVDDFGAPKADRALLPETVEHNALWHHLQAIQRTGHQQAATVCDPAAIEEFLETLADADACLTPNTRQRRFIRAVDRALVPLQGPPGTGKTSGATAPALLARAYAREHAAESFVGIVVAPSHEAVDAVLDGVVDCLDAWRQATGGLSTLRLVRVLPATPPAADARADATAAQVDVTYANYHSTEGETTLRDLASDLFGRTHEAEQCLMFATPATLYRTLGIVAETQSSIDGETAPAAMCHDPGLADIVCIDKASMLDIPRLLLAGSVLKPTGQTLLVGDHRQLATVTATEWTDTLRKPLADTKAYLSALDYIRWLNTTVSQDRCTRTEPPTADGTYQTLLSGFNGTDAAATDNGGDKQ